MNKNKVWGQTRIAADGLQLDTEGKSTLEMGGIKRDPVQGDNRAGFFSESTEQSKVECSVLVTAGLSLMQLGAIEDATVTMQADTGQTYVIRHAYVSEPPSVSEGKAKLIFMGPPAEELTL